MYVGSGARELDHLAFLDLARQHLESFDRSDPEHIRIARDLDARVDRLPFYCVFSRQLATSFGRVTEHGGRARALPRAGRTALAVERYRMANGKLPARLEHLVPDYLDSVPLDPFDGQPLRYEKSDKGYTVYSTGSDGVDDGGQQAPEGSGRDDPDTVFAVERQDRGGDE